MQKKHENRPLPQSIVINMVRSIVWYHSRGALRHIESILIENHIEERKDEITRKVKNALEERANAYIDYFNSLNTKIPKLWSYYSEVFETAPFFEEIMKVVFRKYKLKNSIPEIAIKIKDISEIMYEYQEKANIKVEIELERLSNEEKK